jgi:glutamate-1-semialdehyde aminotransferase
LGQLLDDHRGQVAAVIMEPLRSHEPPEGYLAGVSQLCRDHGAVLIFDEVSTGWRLSVGGAQAWLGVTPDMAVFAKSISNGYPLAVVAGKAEIMQAAERMFISSTYWSDTIGLRAALATLAEVRRRQVPAGLWRFGAELTQRLNEAARQAGLDAVCGGLAVHPALQFAAGDGQTKELISTLYIQEMAKRGCHGYTSFYLNAAQGPAELEQTVAAARETFALIARGLAEGNLAELLQCDVRKESFRRLVR